jgi:HTH-type transcriptional regulator/antitoxin HigA
MERRVVSKKRLFEKELVEGMTPHTAHRDELVEVTLDE